MNAIQFRTFAREGIIKIPSEYQDFLDKELNIIILTAEDTSKRKERFFESVKKHSFKLPPDYKFDRDEMNER
jgi:hypothetical protein